MAALPRNGLVLVLLLACALGRAAEPTGATLTGHAKWVGAVAFSPGSKLVATTSADGTARLWRVDGRSADVFKGHTDTACAVAFCSAGMVTGSHDGTVRLWRASKGPLVVESRRGAVLAIAASPDGQTVAAGGMDGVITLGPVDGKERTRLTGHRTWINALAFSADGSHLASASSDGTARLWDGKTGKQIKAFETTTPVELRGIALSPDGKTIAAAVRYGTVKAWNVVSGKELASLNAHEGEAWSVCFTPDGKTLISGGGDWGRPGTVKLWDATTWKVKRTIAHPAEVLCVAVSRDGKWLAVSGMDRVVRLWQLNSLTK